MIRSAVDFDIPNHIPNHVESCHVGRFVCQCAATSRARSLSGRIHGRLLPDRVCTLAPQNPSSASRRRGRSARRTGCPDGSDAMITPATPRSSNQGQPEIPSPAPATDAPSGERELRSSTSGVPHVLFSRRPNAFPDVICERYFAADRPHSDASQPVHVVTGVRLRLLDDQTPVRSSGDVNDRTPVIDQPHVQRPRRHTHAAIRQPSRAGVPQDLAQPPHPREADACSTSQTPPADSTASRPPNSRPHSGTALSWRRRWAPTLIPPASVSATRKWWPRSRSGTPSTAKRTTQSASSRRGRSALLRFSGSDPAPTPPQDSTPSGRSMP